MNEFVDGRHDDLPIIIPKELDDFGLDPYEFRAYLRIVRRAGSHECYESIANMAQACGMSPRKLHECIESLITLGLLVRTSSGKMEGTTSRYMVTAKAAWKVRSLTTETPGEVGTQCRPTSAHSADPLCTQCRPPLHTVQTEGIPLRNPIKMGRGEKSLAAQEPPALEGFDTADLDPEAQSSSVLQVSARLIERMCELSGKKFQVTTGVERRVKLLLKKAPESQLAIMSEYAWELAVKHGREQYFSPAFLLSSDGYDRHFANAQDWHAKGRRSMGSKNPRENLYEPAPDTPEYNSGSWRMEFFAKHGRKPTQAEVIAHNQSAVEVR